MGLGGGGTIYIYIYILMIYLISCFFLNMIFSVSYHHIGSGKVPLKGLAYLGGGSGSLSTAGGAGHW